MPTEPKATRMMKAKQPSLERLPRKTAFAACLLVCLPGWGAEPPRPTPLAEPSLDHKETAPQPPAPIALRVRAASSALCGRFDTWLKDPVEYRAMALRECGVFPEGKIYPFVLPAIAYANLAVAGDIPNEHAAAQIRKLLDIAIPITGKSVRAPGWDLMQLDTYQHQGTLLGTLNYGLGAYRLVSNDRRYDALHDHLSGLLRAAVVERRGQPIHSYPDYTWNFDTIMALASLELHDRANGASLTEPLLDAHLAWRRENATVSESGLPRAQSRTPSRGCDLSFQVCLLGNLRPAEARELYRAYTEHHWLDHGFVTGFTEWPKGRPATADIDSGPILFGVGGTATGLGIGAALATGDEKRLELLVNELSVISRLLREALASGKRIPLLAWFGDRIAVDEEYLTGFLYGDIALFYAITWTEYPDPRGAE